MTNTRYTVTKTTENYDADGKLIGKTVETTVTTSEYAQPQYHYPIWNGNVGTGDANS